MLNQCFLNGIGCQCSENGHIFFERANLCFAKIAFWWYTMNSQGRKTLHCFGNYRASGLQPFWFITKLGHHESTCHSKGFCFLGRLVGIQTKMCNLSLIDKLYWCHRCLLKRFRICCLVVKIMKWHGSIAGWWNMACCPPKNPEKHMKRSREGRSSFGPALRLNLGNRVANPRVHRSSSWLEEWRCKSQEKNQQWYRWWWWWRRRRLHFKSQEKERVR